MRKHLLTLVCSVGLACMCHAQIVNIEDKRFLKDTTGLFGQLDLGLNWVRNTSSVLSFNTGLRMDYIQKKDTWLFLSNYNLIKTGSNRQVNAGFGHLRWSRRLTDHISWEAFGQSQFDERIKIRYRGLLGTGPRFNLFGKGKQKLFWGILYMFEYNELNDGEGEAYFRDDRLSISLSAQLQLSPTLRVANTSYYQPVISTLGEARLSSGTSVQLKINSHLSFVTTFNITYDARIAAEVGGVPKTIHRLTNRIRWVF
ncbi:MAG: DUF481 domain-containing protein [Saprospiraceae bacterium]|nr:DUF481 domain-containing protein [Saprospiraceae bacterium]